MLVVQLLLPTTVAELIAKQYIYMCNAVRYTSSINSGAECFWCSQTEVQGGRVPQVTPLVMRLPSTKRAPSFNSPASKAIASNAATRCCLIATGPQARCVKTYCLLLLLGWQKLSFLYREMQTRFQ